MNTYQKQLNEMTDTTQRLYLLCAQQLIDNLTNSIDICRRLGLSSKSYKALCCLRDDIKHEFHDANYQVVF